MPTIPTISDAEWEVMAVLWTTSPLTANEVVDRLEGRKTWSPRTVKTLLNRLVNKKALAFETRGNRYLYRPAVAREACVRAESRSFLTRVFGGAAGPAIVHLVANADLSPSEIAELKKLLSKRKD